MKRFQSVFVRIAVSLLAVVVTVYFLRSKIGSAIQILTSEVSWNYFTLACLGYGVTIFILSLRLFIIWQSQGIKLSYAQVLQASYFGLFFNFFLPSSVGGDLIKIYYAHKKGYEKIKATTSVLMDRLLGFVIIIFMATVAALFYRQSLNDPFIYVSLAVFTVTILLFGLLFFSRRVAKRFKFLSAFLPSKRLVDLLKRIYHSFHGYRSELTLIGFGLLLSLIIQSGLVVLYYWVGKSLQADVPLGIYFIVVPITAIVSMMPSLGGLGVREAGSIYLLSKYMTSERAMALTILFDLIIYGFGVLGGVLFAFGGSKQKSVLKNMEALDES